MAKKSKLFNERADGCWLCGNPNVEEHHIYSSSRRPISDREGCVVYLCHLHHQGSVGVHNDSDFNKWLRMECQRRWEKREGVEDDPEHNLFRSVFYESFI